MIRAAKTIFVFSIGLLGCNATDDFRSAPAGQPPRAAGHNGWRCGPGCRRVEVGRGQQGDRDGVVAADAGPQAVQAMRR